MRVSIHYRMSRVNALADTDIEVSKSYSYFVDREHIYFIDNDKSTECYHGMVQQNNT